MNNPFDQFDSQSNGNNPFDQFDKQPAGQAAQSPTAWETPAASMVRGIGQSAQAGLEGMGSLYDLARMPFNALGANIPSATDIIRSHSPFPSPTGIASDLTRGTTAGMASLLPGAGLAESGAPLAAGIGQALTKSPLSQISSFAGSDAAKGMAQRAGVGPAGQMAAQLAGALPGAAMAGFLDAPAEATAGGGNALIKGITADIPEELPDIANAMKRNAGSVINEGREGGVVFNDDKTSGIVSDIGEALKKNDFIPELNPKTTAIVNRIKDIAENDNLTLGQLTQYRTMLSRIGNSEDGVAAGNVKKALSNAIDTAGSDDLLNGDIKSIQLLNQGRSAYAQASKFEDVADVIAKANGDPNRLKQGLTRFANDPDNTIGWTATQKAALNQAKDTGVGENLLKAFGKFGFDFSKSGVGNTALPALSMMSSAIGNPIGVPLAIGGTIARQGQKYLARGYAQDLLDKMRVAQ